MLNIEKYISPSVDLVRLQLEGVIADSLCPRIKNGEVWYEEYTTDALQTPVGQDILIF
jgi:hypothetical protein